MFTIINWPRVGAERFHRFLPDQIRRYLKGRGIPATIIEQKLLGWNDKGITIPIFGRERGEVVGFRYAKPPEDLTDKTEMLADPSAKPELYGWETLAQQPRRIVICEGEFDRLVLEANGFPAVTSTAGVGTFLEEWVPYFASVKHIYICFARTRTSDTAAQRVRALLPAAHVGKLPPDVGEGGDITDYFVRLGRTKVDFEVLLATAAAEDGNDPDDQPPVNVREFRPHRKALRRRAERVRKAVRLHEIVGQYATLQAEGGRLVAHCPFHEDRMPSFTVYPKTDTYYCFGCEAQGDVVQLLMNKESMTFGQALDALERFEFTHEIYGTG